MNHECNVNSRFFILIRSFRCGHCKEFDKTFKKLAKQMQSLHLLFAKMDGVGNDLPPGLEIRGYPTIFFLKAESKHEPVLYEGDRSSADLKVGGWVIRSVTKIIPRFLPRVEFHHTNSISGNGNWICYDLWIFHVKFRRTDIIFMLRKKSLMRCVVLTGYYWQTEKHFVF